MRFLLFTLSFSLILNLQVNCQNQKVVDSLLHQFSLNQPDSVAMRILVKLWDQYVDTDFEESLKYAQQIIELGEQKSDANIIAAGYMRISISYGYIGEIEKSMENNIEAYSIYESNRDTLMMAVIQMNIGVDLTDTGKYQQALDYLDQAEFNFGRSADTLGIGETLDCKCRVRFMQGYYQLAIKDALAAIKIFETRGNSYHHYNTTPRLASIYEALGDTLRSSELYEETINYWEKVGNKRRRLQVMVELAELYVNHGFNLQKSRQLLNQAMPGLLELNDKFTITIVYAALGNLELKFNNLNQARKNIISGLEVAREAKNQKMIALLTIRLGETYALTGNLSQAIQFTRQGLEAAVEIGTLEEQSLAYKVLSEYYQSADLFQDALLVYQSHIKIQDSLYNLKKRREIEELNIIYETEKKEASIALQQKEIQTLNQAARIDNLRKRLYAGGMFTFVAASILLVFGFRQRLRRIRSERQKKEQMLQQELDFKRKELASQTLHLVQKNTFLLDLKVNLEQIKKSPELFNKEFRRIMMLLKQENTSDQDWDIFKSYFSEVHNNFDQKLMKIYPDITEKELRLASFIKMKLSTKEIAAMLNVLSESVLTSKYRLKKKLQLDKEKDLYQFLNAL